VFVLIVAAWILGTVGQIVALMVWGVFQGIWLGAHGVPPAEVGHVIQQNTAALMRNPLIAVAFLFVPFQLVMGLTAVLAASSASESLRARLGLVRPALPSLGLPTVVIGSLVPLAISVALVSLFFPFAVFLPSYPLTSWVTPLALVLFFSVVPPFMEELLFRGYLQRRLLQRWHPAVAILVTSALFAGYHGNLPQMIVAFTLGIWLGVIAWRTGSIWPTMICHGFWNATVQLSGIAYRLEILSPAAALAVAVVVVGLGLACFVLSLRVLARRQEEVVPTMTEEAVCNAA
jgi:membrane protease YdiL (CAAX protease family)